MDDTYDTLSYIVRMRKLKTKWFNKWAKKNKISSTSLTEAIQNVEDGLSTADLGSNLFKVRVAREGSGKSGGFRTLLVYRENDRTIFLYGFAKNEQDNINNSDLKMFKKFGTDLLSFTESNINKAIQDRELFSLEETK